MRRLRSKPQLVDKLCRRYLVMPGNALENRRERSGFDRFVSRNDLVVRAVELCRHPNVRASLAGNLVSQGTQSTGEGGSI